MQGGIFRCSGSCSGKDALHSVGLLPRQVEVRAAEVAIGCDLLVDRTPKVQTADDRRRAQVKALADQLTQAGVGQAARSEGVDKDRDGMGNADGIGQLDLALGGKTGV